MGKPWRKRKPHKRLRGRCQIGDHCRRNGGQKHTCKVCEKLKAAGEFPALDEVYSVQFCDGHAAEAEARIKKHVMSRHKGVLFLAALKYGYED